MYYKVVGYHATEILSRNFPGRLTTSRYRWSDANQYHSSRTATYVPDGAKIYIFGYLGAMGTFNDHTGPIMFPVACINEHVK